MRSYIQINGMNEVKSYKKVFGELAYLVVEPKQICCAPEGSLLVRIGNFKLNRNWLEIELFAKSLNLTIIDIKI